ncbi:MAG: CotH kinase family protein [Bacteroidota bacterium]|nr:CotH kinase family protein [Bacteroidota bacterium]
MRAKLSIVCLALLLASCETVSDSNPASTLDDIPVLDAVIPQDRYVELLSNRWSDEEVPVDIFVSRKRHRGTFEAQGAGSRYHSRWSFKLELDQGTTLNGLNVSNLSAQIFDDSRLRTFLAVEVFSALGFHTFDFHPVFLQLNGRNLGLYLQIERFEQAWFTSRNLPVFELIKSGFGARFSYREGLHLARYFEKEIPDNDNLNNFGDFIHALDAADPDNIFEDVGRWLDIPQYLRYHAAASVLNHVDGFTNNLFFYRATPDAPYTVIPWDFDKLMYEPNDVGLMGGNDIIWKLLQNDSCVTLYKRELWRIVDSVITPERLFPLLDGFADRIAAAHALDPELGQSGIYLGSELNRLKAYLMERRTYFRNNIATITRLPRQ